MKDDSWKVLEPIVYEHLEPNVRDWLAAKIDAIIAKESTKELYLAYSLIGGKIKKETLNLRTEDEALNTFLTTKNSNLQELSRIILLAKVLFEKKDFFKEKVQNLIQIADTGELETFLKYLVLLPNPEDFHFAAVDALRTNIEHVFKAICMHNPYPMHYFDDQQWNQMYLKAAFMQLNLAGIIGVDERANQELTRIISDYAHERWAASRDIDPEFWRPVSNFLNETLIADVERLFKSENSTEVKAAALVCYHSKLPVAKKLLQKNSEQVPAMESGALTWKNFKN